ncbi:Guanine nucleotide-binding-like protein 1 [Phlyctochytrium planicorne]|nr:Guanine nucleotide-binding-like protein 1 [Phlyctochytrium planicorne]
MDKIKEKLEKLRIESDGNLTRAQKAETEVKDLKAELAKRETEAQNNKNRITLLEMDADRNEKKIAELSSTLRTLEITSEQHERKAKQLDNEKLELEKKYEELNEKYFAVKKELDSTAKQKAAQLAAKRARKQAEADHDQDSEGGGGDLGDDGTVPTTTHHGSSQRQRRPRDASTESGAVGDYDTEDTGRMGGKGKRDGRSRDRERDEVGEGDEWEGRKGRSGRKGGDRGASSGRGNAVEEVVEHKLVSVFAKLSPKENEEKKRQSQQPFTRLPVESLEIGFKDLYPTSTMIDFPKRPPWSRSESKEKLEEREEKYFQEWLEETYRTWKKEDLSFFEHNLEVWRQLWRVVEISDIVLFVVDARHPILHFPPKLYDYVVNQMKKKLVLIFNKIDLVDAPTLKAWTDYFQNLYPTLHVAQFSIYPSSVHLPPPPPGSTVHVTRIKADRKVPRFTRSVGVTTVLKACRDVKVDGKNVEWEEMIHEEEVRLKRFEAMERNRERVEARGYDELESDESDDEVEGGPETEDVDEGAISPTKGDVVTIGLVGHPNVGKSSLINGIMGKKVVSTSKTPGHTKHFQTIHINQRVRLCDCPGLVFPGVLPKPLQILSGMYKIAQVQEPYSSVQYLAERVPIERVLKLQPPEEKRDVEGYRWSAWDICEAFALQKGFLTPKAARPDVYRAANLILRMANDGRLLLAFKPPGFFEKMKEEAAQVVMKWKKGDADDAVDENENDADDDADVEDEEDEDDGNDEDEDTQVGRTVNAFALLDCDD